MKVAVVAANGKAGRLISQEAVNRGMDVTAIVDEIENAAHVRERISVLGE